MKPRIHAYVLAGDAAFLSASLKSYAAIVDRTFISYDVDNLSWTGRPLPMGPSLDVARSVDTDGKITELPGNWSNPAMSPLDCDTAQRQHAVDACSEGADWVLQLDADEVLPDYGALLAALCQADSEGFDALDFPARWLYATARRGRVLESSGRFWQRAASYPGSVAVRAGAELSHCRQTRLSTYRVDFARMNTDPWHPRTAPVHHVVRANKGILHYAWARSSEQLHQKAIYSGHASDFDWGASIRRWEWRQRHLWLSVAGTPMRRPGHQQWLRVSRLNE